MSNKPEIAAVTELPPGRVKAVFTDLDGTLTSGSRVRPETVASLWRLREAGFWTVIVTGRPAGWADCLLRLWPVDSVIFENGAGVMRREGDSHVTTTLAAGMPREQQYAILLEILQKVREEVPRIKLASDQAFRLYDIAIDFNEEPPRLTQGEVEKILEILHADDRITAKLSSIHVNFWVGSHTKVTACEWLLAGEGRARGVTRENVVFSGDSPNDEPLFEFFPLSVGVANVREFIPRMKALPAYLTEGAEGEGFQELARHLLGN